MNDDKNLVDSHMDSKNISGYIWNDSILNDAHNYLLPALFNELRKIEFSNIEEKKVFEVGCGNGSVANRLSLADYSVIGVDPSIDGIKEANLAFPELSLFKGSAYDDLSGTYGEFPIVVSLEVVEHVYFPRLYAKTIFKLLQPGGTAIISTPYHGYWKNLALAITGKMDLHFTALWDHGHIKFWSRETLKELLLEAGFSNIKFVRVGRIPLFAKSMIAIVTK
jgi:2-polyprenyl-3-methyl-5-hydroxy-6-metoxy-1,4-benzoquinol methylase